MTDSSTTQAKLEEIIHISNKMVMMRDLEPLMALALNEVVTLFGAEHGFIILVNEKDPNTYQINSYKEEPSTNLLENNISSSILAKVISTNESIVVTNALDDDHFANAKSVIYLKLRSVICAPLRHNSTNLGAIYLENKEIAHRFSEKDLPLLELFANQASVAIVNARLNASLNIANGQLAKLNAQKSKLIQIIAHELRTPATNISLLIDLYRRNNNPKYLNRLESVSKEIIQQVEEMTLISTIFSEQLELALSQFRVQSIINNLIQELSNALQSRGISIHVLNNDEQRLMTGDREKLTIAFLHLLSNAVKYSPDDETIEIHIAASERSVEIKIIDRGVGIPNDELEHVFELFYTLGNAQYHSTSRFDFMGNGLGIGLPLVKSIVTAHGGHVELTNAQSGNAAFPGTVCLVRLPLQPA